MTARATVFAYSHHGNAFGIKGPQYGPAGHRGDDTKGWGKGTAIPSLFSGRVVRKAASAVLGNTVSIQRADGITFGYCHMNSPSTLTLGQQIQADDTVGYFGETGTAANGVHVHVTAMPHGYDPALSDVVDPRPYIDTAIGLGGGTAGEGSHPITPSTPQEHDMFTDNIKIIGPYAQGGRGVIGAGIGYAFPSEDVLASFLGVWGLGTPAQYAFAWVGDAGRTAAQNLQVFYDLIKLHASNQSLTMDAPPAVGGGTGYTPAQIAAAVETQLQDDFAKIAPADLTGITAQLTALAKQGSDEQAALLAAISQVDENTLATFGLKRA